MADTLTRTIVDEALALRSSHPGAPALDILDLVFKGRHQSHPDFEADGAQFDDWLDPPSPFARLLRDAFAADLPDDPFFVAHYWSAVLDDGTPLSDVFHERVIRPFTERYQLWT